MWLPLLGCLRGGLREDALVTLDILGLLERSIFRTREEHVCVLLDRGADATQSGRSAILMRTRVNYSPVGLFLQCGDLFASIFRVCGGEVRKRPGHEDCPMALW